MFKLNNHLCITQMEKKWTKWYAMTSHVIACRLKELLFGTHAFNYPHAFLKKRRGYCNRLRLSVRLSVRQAISS